MGKGNLKGKIFVLGQWFLLVSGLLLLVIGKMGLGDWKEIPFNIGIAFISASLISFLNKWLFGNDSNSLEKKWGLKNIYEHRFEKDQKTNDYVIRKAVQIDVMTQDSLITLRKNLGKDLQNRLKNGLKMRILIPKIHLPAADIVELLEWCKATDVNKQGNIQLRTYEGTPQDLYFRVDDMIFVGPYFAGKYADINHMTITYEFKKDSKGGEIYFSYFEEIWGKGGIIF